MFRWRGRGCKNYEPLQRRLRTTLQRGAAQSECSRTAKTCANLLRLWPALWTFTHHPDVEPTNNAAEQALRGIVLKRKISGPTRSRRGEEFIARVSISAHRGRHFRLIVDGISTGSWTAFQSDRGRRFSGIVDDGDGAQVIF